MNCSAFTGLDLNIERGALLLDWPPLKESADIRNRRGSAVGQRRTTCPVENSEPGFCLQTGGMTRGLALALAGGSPMLLTACHQEITATCLSFHDADG